MAEIPASTNAVASSVQAPFRFLDLLPELRKMVYEELFRGSYNEIKIKAPGEYTEIILVDEELPENHYRRTVHSSRPLQAVKLSHNHSGITLASKQIRRESFPLLSKMTAIVMRGRVAQSHVERFLDLNNAELLESFRTLRFITTLPVVDLWTSELEMLVKYFTGLEMIDFGIDIHDLPWAESSLRLWMMSQEGNTDVEEVEDLDPSELINVHLLSSHGALKYHAKARLAQHYDKIKQFHPELAVSCTLISPIPALTKDMDKAKEDRQYGQVRFDGTDYTSRSIGWEESSQPGFQAFARPEKK